jgi:hypothetical protein
MPGAILILGASAPIGEKKFYRETLSKISSAVENW